MHKKEKNKKNYQLDIILHENAWIYAFIAGCSLITIYIDETLHNRKLYRAKCAIYCGKKS